MQYLPLNYTLYSFYVAPNGHENFLFTLKLQQENLLFQFYDTCDVSITFNLLDLASFMKQNKSHKLKKKVFVPFFFKHIKLFIIHLNVHTIITSREERYFVVAESL